MKEKAKGFDVFKDREVNEFKAGDIVKIVKSLPEGDYDLPGFSNYWVKDMDKQVGKTLVVTSADQSGVYFEGDVDYLGFPPCCLELVNREVKSSKTTSKGLMTKIRELEEELNVLKSKVELNVGSVLIDNEGQEWEIFSYGSNWQLVNLKKKECRYLPLLEEREVKLAIGDFDFKG